MWGAITVRERISRGKSGRGQGQSLPRYSRRSRVGGPPGNGGRYLIVAPEP